MVCKTASKMDSDSELIGTAAAVAAYLRHVKRPERL